MSIHSDNKTPLVLVPGMAADASIFAAQAADLSELIVVDWVEPLRHESLGGYAKRLAESIKVPPGCLLGGASFGGIVALEMAPYIKPSGVVLIGSVRSPEELPRWIQRLRFAAPLVALAPIGLIQILVSALNVTVIRRKNPRLSAIVSQFCNANRRLLRWSVGELLRWRETPLADCPVTRVHGDKDRVFPLRSLSSSPDRVVAGGGHVISLSHAIEVSDFLQECLAATAQAEGRI